MSRWREVLRHPGSVVRRPPAPPTTVGPTFCAHRLHCQECHEQTVAHAKSWAQALDARDARIAALERALAESEGRGE